MTLLLLLALACASNQEDECLDPATADFAAEYATLYCDAAFLCYGPNPLPPFDLESCYYLLYDIFAEEDYDPCLARTCLDDLQDATTCENSGDSVSELRPVSCVDAFGLQEVTGG